MIILVDLDGVMADWGANYDKHLNLNPKLAHIPRTANQLSFGIMDNLPPDDRQGILDIMNKERFYAELEPIPGSVEAVRQMVEDGHTVFIVTSPWIGNVSCLQDKQDWVEKHIGKGWAERLILTRDKTVVLGDILIDDKPEITGRVIPIWEHIYFDQPYNQVDTSKRRILDWDNWKDVVYLDTWQLSGR